MKGTYNFCNGCRKWMEHKRVSKSVYKCVNCGTLVEMTRKE